MSVVNYINSSMLIIIAFFLADFARKRFCFVAFYVRIKIEIVF